MTPCPKFMKKDVFQTLEQEVKETNLKQKEDRPPSWQSVFFLW